MVSSNANEFEKIKGEYLEHVKEERAAVSERWNSLILSIEEFFEEQKKEQETNNNNGGENKKFKKQKKHHLSKPTKVSRDDLIEIVNILRYFSKSFLWQPDSKEFDSFFRSADEDRDNLLSESEFTKFFHLCLDAAEKQLQNYQWKQLAAGRKRVLQRFALLWEQFILLTNNNPAELATLIDLTIEGDPPTTTTFTKEQICIKLDEILGGGAADLYEDARRNFALAFAGEELLPLSILWWDEYFLRQKEEEKNQEQEEKEGEEIVNSSSISTLPREKFRQLACEGIESFWTNIAVMTKGLIEYFGKDEENGSFVAVLYQSDYVPNGWKISDALHLAALKDKRRNEIAAEKRRVANAYLESKDIVSLTHELVKALLEKKPEDHLQFALDWIVEKRKK